MLESIRPPRLRPGDTIGVITPGRAALFPRRLDRGIAALAALGFDVRPGSHALKPEQTDDERVADLHAMFLDPGVRAVLLTLAGEAATMSRLLPLIDFDLLAAHPTILVGQSAATTLLLAITARTGLVTFHGPSVIQHFGDIEGPDPVTVSNLLAVLSGKEAAYVPASRFSDAYQDWDVEDALRPYAAGMPWRAIRPGVATGRLMGGSLRAIIRNLESPFAANFRDALLFWDLAYFPTTLPEREAAPYLLAELDRCGALANTAGMLVSKPYLYDGRDQGLPSFDAVITDSLKRYDKPLLAGLDCGHTVPMLTLPLGVNAAIDANQNQFHLLEVPVS